MRRALAAIALAGLGGPALAVGLGPLEKSGVTDGPSKGFYLVVSNPYRRVEDFKAYPAVLGGEGAPDSVRIVPDRMRIAANGQRRILVIASALEPGETRAFRVCAEAAQQKGMIHARVCSKLVARRIAG